MRLSTLLQQHLSDLLVASRPSGVESVAKPATLCIDVGTILQQATSSTVRAISIQSAPDIWQPTNSIPLSPEN